MNTVPIANRFIAALWVTLLLCTTLLAPLSVKAQGDSDDSSASSSAPQPQNLTIVSYVTWWSHDATGYHPAIYLKYENDSGRDLSGQLIRFQCRFTDVRNGYVTVARKEMRTDLDRFRQQHVLLRGPSPFELPIDENAWPNIECKAMCRIGDVGDEGTQDLILCRLDSITMTDDEGLEKLNKQDDIRKARFSNSSLKSSKRPRPETNEAPLSAKTPALSLNSQNNKPSKNSTKAVTAVDFSLKSKGPGLGDDFFDFEQAFGRPLETDPNSGKWTWAHFREPDNSDVYAGAHKPGSKADLIISTVKSNKPLTDSQLSAIAHAYAGKYKSQSLGSFTHTVRYLPSGRVQMTKMTAPTFHLSAYNIDNANDPSSNYVLVLSRLPVTDETTVTDQIKRSRILKFVTNMIGDLDKE